MLEKSYQNPLRAGMRLQSTPRAASLIILGATGDLTRRKLMPALFSLFKQGLLPSDFTIIGFARRPKTNEEFRQDMRNALNQFSASAPGEPVAVERFLENVHYHRGDFTDQKAYESLAQLLDSRKESNSAANKIFYLATPPSQYEAIIANLGLAHLNENPAGGWTRIIIEKPFGRDLESASALNKAARSVFQENQIYRIDHYLGKETVQNLLVFRFANGIFEPIWNRRYVDHVQITVAESIGVEGRGRFFEETGILRDIVQNHMMQLLCLVAMEPPSTFKANAVRDEKVKVLHAVRPITEEQVEQLTVRGQYAAGSLFGAQKPGYLQEDGVSPDSTTETYAALKLELNNWRWAGVPFYLRAGKRLPKRVTEIAIYFREAPLQIFGPQAEEEAVPNVLALNIQPDEGISLRFDSKVPGPSGLIRPVTMDFRYGTSFGEVTPDAYERLLLDAWLGDSTLFTRADENEIAWDIVTPILNTWANSSRKLPQYLIGTWGPKEADEFIKRDGRRWRRL